jgi:hypothetical protein
MQPAFTMGMGVVTLLVGFAVRGLDMNNRRTVQTAPGQAVAA